MRRMVSLALALLILAPAADARRKVTKAGEMKDGVYTDRTYKFSIKVHDNWQIRINKDEDPERIVLIQKKYGIPADYVDAPDYTEIPKLTLYVDTTSLGPYAFLDSLTHDDFKSDQKDDIKSEFDFLQLQEIIPMGRSPWKVDDEAGLVWTGQSKYVKEVQTSAGSIGGKRVYGSYGGTIAAVKHGKHIFLFHMMCEWPYFETVMGEVNQMLGSFTFENGKEKKKEGKS